MRNAEVAATGVEPGRGYKLYKRPGHYMSFQFCLTLTVVLFLSLSASPRAEIKPEPIPNGQGQEIMCAEKCALARDVARKRCDIIYDDGLCFGYLPCLDDTEVALRQCENIADTIYYGCASRCYKPLLEKAAGE